VDVAESTITEKDRVLEIAVWKLFQEKNSQSFLRKKGGN
jgi:hypothetical protein